MKTAAIFLLSALSLSLTAQEFNREKLNQYFDVLEKEEQAMGSVALAKNGELIYQRQLGFAHLADSVRPNAQTQYRIGSVSKTFTAVLILKLEKEGLLKRNQKLSVYYPEIINAEKITLKMLLNHTSGIHNFTDDESYTQYLSEPKSAEKLLEIIQKGGSDFEPGSQFSYSNSNYVLLSLIAEKAGQASFAELLRKKVIEPAQLEHTQVGKAINHKQNQALSYQWGNGYEPASETHMSIPLGGGNLISTPSDLCRFFYQLRGGKILDQATADAMLPEMGDSYGLGILSFPFEGRVAYGHTGGIDGFNSMAGHFKEEGLSIAYSFNGLQMDPNEIAIAMLSAYFGKDFKIPNFTSYAASAQELNAVTGTYSSSNFPLDIKVFVENDVLKAQATGQAAFVLKPTAPNRFEFTPADILMQFSPEKDQLTFTQMGRKIMFKR